MPDANRRELTQPYGFTPPTLDDSGVRRKPFHDHGPASEPTQLSVGSNGPISATLLAAQVPSPRSLPPSRDAAPPPSQPTTMFDLAARRASAMQRIAHGAMTAKVARESEAARTPPPSSFVPDTTPTSLPSFRPLPFGHAHPLPPVVPPAWVMPTPQAMPIPTLVPMAVPPLGSVPMAPAPGASRGMILATAAAVGLVAIVLTMLVVVRGPGRMSGAVEAPPATTAGLQAEPVVTPAVSAAPEPAPPAPAPSFEGVTAPPEVAPAPPSPASSSVGKTERHPKGARGASRVTLPKHTSGH